MDPRLQPAGTEESLSFLGEKRNSLWRCRAWPAVWSLWEKAPGVEGSPAPPPPEGPRDPPGPGPLGPGPLGRCGCCCTQGEGVCAFARPPRPDRAPRSSLLPEERVQEGREGSLFLKILPAQIPLSPRMEMVTKMPRIGRNSEQSSCFPHHLGIISGIN